MMMTKILSAEPLLESLLIIDFPECIIDLHNEFECISINANTDFLNFTFQGDKNILVNINLVSPIILKQEVKFDLVGPITLDNFYRGRLLVDNELHDISTAGEYCFYFHFYESVYFEILTKKIILELTKV